MLNFQSQNFVSQAALVITAPSFFYSDDRLHSVKMEIVAVRAKVLFRRRVAIPVERFANFVTLGKTFIKMCHVHG